MTSRRARIKGIANIPARRKNDAPNADIDVKPEPATPVKNVQPSDDVKVGQPSPPKTNETTEPDKDVKQLSTKNDSREVSIKTEKSSQNNSQPSNLNQPSSPSTATTDYKNELAVKLDSSNKEIEVFRTSDSKIQCTDVTNQNETQSESVDSNCEVPKSTGESCTKPDVSEKSQEGPKFARRWVPRPAVKIPAIARRSKPAELPLKESPANQNIEIEELVAQTNDVINNVSTEVLRSPPRLDPPATLAINKLPSTPDLSIKIPTEPDRTLASPLSPSKTLNRARIRPSPKLIRRNSVQGSASESEDDGRRSRNRIRNDSVCSITSYTTETPPIKDNVSAVRDRLNTCYKVHKLFRRSEQTRKVAESRREFYQKFGTTIPDRKRLTMMDLIYYNPVTNPMPKRESKTNNESEIIETIEDENPPPEEDVDDPEAEANVEEDATPVPQVKVGPNGEIILDEQSLVIEQTGTKKGREQLANSQIVNVDDLDRAYGIYTRPKRSKEWNVVETLRFYKSLNTVGTDFSLMVSLFPGRTRRELKIKFKKEEKINRALIDKALMNPVEFDFAELEQQLVADELALAAVQEEKEKRKQKTRKQRKRKSASALSADMDEENVDGNLEERKVVKKPRKEKKDKYSVLENGLDELINSISDSDNEENVTANNTERISRPARACRRISKYTDDSEIEEEDEDTNNNETSVEKNDISKDKTSNTETVNITAEIEASVTEENGIIEDENMMECSGTIEEENANEQNGTIEDSIIEENGTEEKEESCVDGKANENNQLVPVSDEQNCAVPNILPNDLSTVEPGSLMILSSQAPDGQQIFKVFMVTPGQTKVPVNLSPDVVKSLTTSLGTAEAITLDLPVINDSDKSVIPDSDTAVTT